MCYILSYSTVQLRLVSLGECCVGFYQNNELYVIEFYVGYIYTFDSVRETNVRLNK